MTIWFASGNINKKKELAAILNAASGSPQTPWEIQIPSDAGLDFDPEETGTTFCENALLKARGLYSLLEQRRHEKAIFSLYKTGDPIIADDSGICVDALGGRPGIYSARYAGRHTGQSGGHPPKKLDAAERNVLLLDEMGGTAVRSARFVCAMVLMFSPDRFFLAQETFEGEIVQSHALARGAGGFGYDPIMFIPGLGRTVAELSEEKKNSISHRAKAGKIIASIIEACS